MTKEKKHKLHEALQNIDIYCDPLNKEEICLDGWVSLKELKYIVEKLEEYFKE